jgi:ribonucleoside-diphosphate reductase beta chain
MCATEQMIAYIRRDEASHITIFQNIIKTLKNEFQEIYNEPLIYEMFKIAVEQEIKW